ncbi:oxidoreductase [Benzoatithermus flavus]|uniref:Oxidoreductase molybdopterin-binding domain-containing protein n=1 Tax=Benzoatithermus flavus TaxID=3108223 RepID=A0ABU8XQV8_9PROT
MITRLAGLLVLASCLLAGQTARAGTLPEPSGPVLLTVTGAITNRNGPDGARFDRAMLEALGLSELKTSTSWTDGVPTFRGVLAARLLDAVGATGKVLHAVAANDYAVDLDADEMRRYPILLAMEQDGKQLRLRDRGPIWVVLPRDAYPELQSVSQDQKWIWQVRSIEVR